MDDWPYAETVGHSPQVRTGSSRAVVVLLKDIFDRNLGSKASIWLCPKAQLAARSLKPKPPLRSLKRKRPQWPPLSGRGLLESIHILRCPPEEDQCSDEALCAYGAADD